MIQLNKQNLTDASVIAWILENKFVNENHKPIEFINHRFLIDYLHDDHYDIVSPKCSQVGLTVGESLKSFHYAGKKKLNIIHTLQNSDVIRGFVVPKVNPLIANNPAIANMLKVDSESLKQFNDNYIYYRGAQAESQAINISADVLINDEIDRSNQKVVEMYGSRLDFSDYKWFRRFSNPSSVGFGVDALWQTSDQRHWFVKCSHCNHQWFIDFEQDGKAHYVNKNLGIYACGKCGKEITKYDRINGQWVAKYPSRSSSRHGYWFSQMMAPWFSAADILKKYNESSQDFFYNFVLGRAYTPSDLVVNRETILKACTPSTIVKQNCALGVDNGIRKTWVLGTPDGVFAHGVTESWDDIEKLILMYDPYVVIDPNPYPTTPKMLVKKYPKKVFICYFSEDSKTLKTVRWGDGIKYGVVYADRTKIIDLVAQEITEAKLLFRETPYQLEDYIEQWGNIYRTSVEDSNGRTKSEWLKKEGKLNDYALATVYFRIALSKMLSGFGTSTVVEASGVASNNNLTSIDGNIKLDITKDITKSMSNVSGDWRTM